MLEDQEIQEKMPGLHNSSYSLQTQAWFLLPAILAHGRLKWDITDSKQDPIPPPKKGHQMCLCSGSRASNSSRGLSFFPLHPQSLLLSLDEGAQRMLKEEGPLWSQPAYLTPKVEGGGDQTPIEERIPVKTVRFPPSTVWQHHHCPGPPAIASGSLAPPCAYK